MLIISSSAGRSREYFIHLQVQSTSVAVLRVLDNEHHEKGDDCCAGVGNQLPRPLAGSRWTFAVAVSAIVMWAASGPYFRYSDCCPIGKALKAGTAILGCVMGGDSNGGVRLGIMSCYIRFAAIACDASTPSLSRRVSAKCSCGKSAMLGG